VTVIVKVVTERVIAGDRLMIYIGASESRLEIAGILWVDHAVSAEIVRRLEEKPGAAAPD
jgi:hypothetical protein